RSLPRPRRSSASSRTSSRLLPQAETLGEFLVELVLLAHEALGLGGRADRRDAGELLVAGEPGFIACELHERLTPLPDYFLWKLRRPGERRPCREVFPPRPAEAACRR